MRGTIVGALNFIQTEKEKNEKLLVVNLIII
jgi:hypothetical protein